MPIRAASLPFLGEVVALFALSAFIAYLCTRIRLVSNAGVLLTGVAVGPYALGLVDDPELVGTLAEIGVILLLFEIGIEFSLSKWARLKRAIGLGGGLQVGGTVVLVTGTGLWAGVDLGPSVYTGFLVALSSTAVVLCLLASRGETNPPAGQVSRAVLIFQDLAIVAMVLLVSMLAGMGGSVWAVLGALGTALIVIAATLLLAWTILPPVLEAVANTRRPELFVLVVAAIALGTAWLVNQAGVSLELGAFLAGLVVVNDQDAAVRISHVVRHENPTLQIVARTRFLSDFDRFRKVGTDIVVAEEVETTVQIFSHVLRAYRVSEEKIREQARTLRSHDYEVLRGEEGASLGLEGLGDEEMRTRTIRVPEGCPAVGRTLGDLRLQDAYDLTVLAVRRRAETLSSVSEGLRLEAGDRLIVLGAADDLLACADLFRGRERGPRSSRPSSKIE